MSKRSTKNQKYEYSDLSDTHESEEESNKYRYGSGGGKQLSGSVSEQTEEDYATESDESTGADVNGKKYSDKQLESEARVEWSEAEFIGYHKLSAHDLIRDKGTLKHNGDIVFSVEQKNLFYGTRTNASDFLEETSKSKRSGSSQKKFNANRDIVKSIDITDLKMGPYDMVLISTPSVPRFQSEGFYNDASFVNRVVLSGEIPTKGKGAELSLVNRNIKTSVLIWQNKYKGITAETVKRDIQYCDEKLSLVKLTSPLVGFFNADHANDKSKQFRRPNKGLEATNQVMMKNRDVKKYTHKTQDTMRQLISYGNITSGFQIIFSVPHNNENERYASSQGKEGSPYYAFFGAKQFAGHVQGKTLPEIRRSMSEVDMGVISFRLKIKYLHVTDAPIPFAI